VIGTGGQAVLPPVGSAAYASCVNTRAFAVAAVLLLVGCTSHSTSPPGDGINVVVSKDDIPAGTPFNVVIRRGWLTTVMVPSNLIVPNAATSIDELRGFKTAAPIYQNEQIPLERVTNDVGF
jgi:hypothetical protein